MSRQTDADALGRELVRLVDRTRADCAAQCMEGLERAAYLLLARLVAKGPQRLSALAEAVQLVALEFVQRHPDPQRAYRRGAGWPAPDIQRLVALLDRLNTDFEIYRARSDAAGEHPPREGPCR